jgi:ParB family chromosome partitioning protein
VSRNALGKGLSALIPGRPPGEGPATPAVSLIPIDRISPNPHQPRKQFEPQALDELVESIRTRGVLQPVLVRKSAAGYELIAGERRWRAATQAGLKEIPALVKEAGKEESLVLALVENLQRENLNPIESARAYQDLADEFHLSQEDIARLMSKDRASIANYLRLLKLPLAIQEDVATGRLSMGHARALLALPDHARQQAARDQVIARGLSVRETEELARKVARPGRRLKPRKGATDPHLFAAEEELKRTLGTKVHIKRQGTRGMIQIHFHSDDELNRLVDHLMIVKP